MAGAIGGLVGGIASNVLGGVASNLLGGAVSSLVSSFGMGQVAGALTNTFMGSLGDALKNVINNSPLPNFLKAAANQVIDSVIGNNQQPTSPECQCAVDDQYGDVMNNISQGIADEAAEEAEGKEGGNWLVALAGALANVQSKFLNKAMDNMEIMENNSDPEKVKESYSDEKKEEIRSENEKQRNEFIKAQSEYQANMQMFNMMANMTSTSLKSIGEGLTALARKQ